MPRDDGPEIDEHAAIQQQIQDLRYVRRMRLPREPPIVRKAVPGSKRDQEVVNPQGAAEADGEDGEQEIED